MEEMNKDGMRACADNCQACYASCTHTAAHCMTRGGKHAEAMHLTMMQDCARICATSADFLLRHSTQHAEICRACAVICRMCETDCRSFGDDPMMLECAEACRKCAESCERMAGMAA